MQNRVFHHIMLLVLTLAYGCATTGIDSKKSDDLSTLTLQDDQHVAIESECPEFADPDTKTIIQEMDETGPTEQHEVCTEHLVEDEPITEDFEPYYLDVPKKPHIVRCQNYFLKKYRRDYLAGLKRRKKFGSLIDIRLEQRKLPADLKWIPMVETWFQDDARSKSRAVGLWQFIPATAKSFGLEINDWVDDRRDPLKSTDAALDVLEYLHGKTGNWLLTLAAYNAGEGCINRAIRKVGSRDYWTLAKHRAIPSQTRFYVSAILALSAIEQNPDHFGVTIPECNPPDIVTINLDQRINLYDLSDQSKVPVKELKGLNPGLKTAWTPPDNQRFSLHCHRSRYQDILAAIELLKDKKTDRLIIHTIEPGDTLSGLARQYKSTVQAIMTANKLTQHIIVVGNKLFIPAGLTWD